ncbi:MAG: hypothetical protein MJ016_05145, partial [Victivallaceae bacterium]|nr:hypothetical protein [Victivallaceae bacterium]
AVSLSHVKARVAAPEVLFGGGGRGVAVVPVDALRSFIAARADRLRTTMTVDRDFRVEVEPAAVSAVWESAFAGKFTALLASVPDGAVAFSRKYGTVRTSTNVAAVETMPRGFALTTSQRSFDDGERTRIAAKVCRHFRSIASGWDFSKGYPGWKPENSPWLRRAAEHWRRVNGTEAVFEAVHAGVECGIFRGRRENLPIFACFPRHGGLHTPAEFLDIASVGRVWKFLISFLREAAHAGNERN